MKHAHLPSIAVRSLAYAICGLFFAGAQYPSASLRTSAAPLQTNQLASRAQSSSKEAAKSTQSKIQRVANPLNDLLDEAQRHIDKSEFEAAVSPLQKVVAEQPGFAYAHFQLAYGFTALKKTEEARAGNERTTAIDPKMSEAHLDLGILLLDKDPSASLAPRTQA